MNQLINQLLAESQRAKLTERRTEARHELVRPVNIYLGDDDSCFGFSKNLSKQGIGVIIDEEFSVGIIACLLYTSPSPRDLSTSRMPSSA